jgi:hypothetical protein
MDDDDLLTQHSEQEQEEPQDDPHGCADGADLASWHRLHAGS